MEFNIYNHVLIRVWLPETKSFHYIRGTEGGIPLPQSPPCCTAMYFLLHFHCTLQAILHTLEDKARDIQLVAICNLTATFQKILHTGPLNSHLKRWFLVMITTDLCHKTPRVFAWTRKALNKCARFFFVLFFFSSGSMRNLWNTRWEWFPGREIKTENLPESI